MMGTIHHALFSHANPMNSANSRPKCFKNLMFSFRRAESEEPRAKGPDQSPELGPDFLSSVCA